MSTVAGAGQTTTQIQLVTQTQTQTVIQTVQPTEDQSEYSNTVNGAEGNNVQVASWYAEYPGHINITGTSTNSKFFIIVTDSFPGYPLNTYQYIFGLGTTLEIPILAGTVTVTVGAPCGALGCTLQGGSFSATLAVTYVVP